MLYVLKRHRHFAYAVAHNTTPLSSIIRVGAENYDRISYKTNA